MSRFDTSSTSVATTDDKKFSYIQLQAEADAYTSTNVPSAARTGPQNRSESLEAVLNEMSPAHRARLTLQLVRIFGAENNRVTPNFEAATILSVLGTAGIVLLEGSAITASSSTLSSLDIISAMKLADVRATIRFGTDTDLSVRMLPPSALTLDAAGHISALTAKALLLRGPYTDAQSYFHASIDRASYSNELKGCMKRWIDSVPLFRLPAGFRSMKTRGEFILAISFAAAMGRHTFRRRIYQMYRRDIAEVYARRLWDPLMVDIAGAVVVGEVPNIYGGLVHLIRPAKRT